MSDFDPRAIEFSPYQVEKMLRIRVVFALAFAALPLLSGCGDGPITTPLEDAQADVLTSYDEMSAFFVDLKGKTGAFTLDTIGESVQGRNLYLLHFTSGGDEAAVSPERVKVLIFAQQHGNEHSGMQASITLARDIAVGTFTDFLDNVDFYLIPQVNPDGSELRQRRNADEMDLNRDHLTLTTPEVQAVHRVFQEVMPQVVLDVHEYGIASSAWTDKGYYKDFGQQIDGQTNANMAPELRAYAVDRVIATMRDALVEKDVDLHRYLVTDGPDARFRHSTAALNDGRNSTGIYNALTFLIEGRNGMTVEDNIQERARQQMETMKAFLTFMSENRAEVKGLVEEKQAELAGPNPPEEVALVMDYVKDPANPTVTVGVVDIETGEKESLVINEYYPVVEASLYVKRPLGYLIKPDQTEILEVLQRHGIEMRTLEEDVTGVGRGYAFMGMEETVKEDKPYLDMDFLQTSDEATVYGKAGDIFIPCQGIQSNLIVSLLEPQSQWGLAQLPEFRHFLEVGRVWPAFRVMAFND